MQALIYLGNLSISEPVTTLYFMFLIKLELLKEPVGFFFCTKLVGVSLIYVVRFKERK